MPFKAHLGVPRVAARIALVEAVGERPLCAYEVFGRVFRARVAVAVVPSHASVKAQLVFLFVVEVETEHLRRLQSAPSAAEPSASPAEAAVVGVVGAAESHQPQLVGKPHSHEPCGIAVFSSVREVGVRQQSFVHAFLYSEVEHGLFLAVVDARHPGEVALLVVRFHLLYYRGRQVFQSGLGVSHHKLLAVYENLLYLLAVDCYVSVVVNLGSRQSFYQLFDHRPLGSPVGRSVVDKRVFACGHLQGAAGHGGPLQHYGVGFHAYRAQRHVLSAADGDVLVVSLEAYARHLQYVLAVGRGCYAERTVCGGQPSLGHCAVGLQQFHRCHGQRLVCFSFDDLSGHVALRERSESCRHDGNQQ